MGVSKTAYYYRPKHKTGNAKIAAYLKRLSHDHPRWGFDRMMAKARLDDKPWNPKQVYCVYYDQGLNIRVKLRKRIPSGQGEVLVRTIALNI